MSAGDSQVVCLNGEQCYRVLPLHFQQYAHPHLQALLNRTKKGDLKIPDDYKPKISPDILEKQLNIISCIRAGNSTTSGSEQTGERHKLSIEDKMKAAAPYNFFLSEISAERATHTENLSVTFQDLLDRSLGELVSSLQINFIVDIGWLLAQYHYTGNRGTLLTLLYGMMDAELEDLLKKGKLPHVTARFVKTTSMFGHHHTKMMILRYADNSLRIIVHTGNLIQADWENRVQGIWISPKILPLSNPRDTGGDSHTNFKKDLLRYLKCYELPGILKSWISIIEEADFSCVNVFLVPSVPGKHSYLESRSLWGHIYLRKILGYFISMPHREYAGTLIYQSSSVGSLGRKENDWFIEEFTASASAANDYRDTLCRDVQFIYPTVRNVLGAHGSVYTAGCLTYSVGTHNKQMWLDHFLRQWKADRRNRSRAVPHIKTYCRLSEKQEEIYWFMLTSANLSKAAWGKQIGNSETVEIWSYEVGVLFVPQVIFGECTHSFPLRRGSDTYPVFPLPYDVPTVEYEKGDAPWFIETPNEV